MITYTSGKDELGEQGVMNNARFPYILLDEPHVKNEL
jgi:hypothetical protein